MSECKFDYERLRDFVHKNSDGRFSLENDKLRRKMQNNETEHAHCYQKWHVQIKICRILAFLNCFGIFQ